MFFEQGARFSFYNVIERAPGSVGNNRCACGKCLDGRNAEVLFAGEEGGPAVGVQVGQRLVVHAAQELDVRGGARFFVPASALKVKVWSSQFL